VILSTHIVEDVAVLCARFAVIRGGRLLTVTNPTEARKSLANTIFEGSVQPKDYDSLRQQRCVTKAYLVEGRNQVRVYQPNGAPPPGFLPVEATLEDAYLLHMRDATPKSIDTTWDQGRLQSSSASVGASI
jgi:ABC-type multidrug transport system ATPase subunit